MGKDGKQKLLNNLTHIVSGILALLVLGSGGGRLCTHTDIEQVNANHTDNLGWI